MDEIYNAVFFENNEIMLKRIKIQKLIIKAAIVLLNIISAMYLKVVVVSEENNSNVFIQRRAIIKQIVGAIYDFTDSKYLFIKMITHYFYKNTKKTF